LTASRSPTEKMLIQKSDQMPSGIYWRDKGQLSFDASIENGDIIPLKNGATVLKLFDPTLDVPFTIDLSAVTQIGHVIVGHGPPQVGLRGAQIGTRGGGCTIGTEKGGKNGPFGTFDCRPAQDIEY